MGHNVEKEKNNFKTNDTTYISSLSRQIDLLTTRSLTIHSVIDNLINTGIFISSSKKENQTPLDSNDKIQSKVYNEMTNLKNNVKEYDDDNATGNEYSKTITLKSSLLESIKELQRINDELIESLKSLKEKYELQNEFINIAAHEIRTPTQAITGYVELLNLGSENSKRYQNLIIRNAEILNVLVSNILDTSRIDNKTLILKKENFDIVKLLEQIVEDFSRSRIYNEKKIPIFFENHIYEHKEIIKNKAQYSNRNKKKESQMIYADRSRITQVITNLLQNAIRHTNNGGKITITLEKNILNKNSQLPNQDKSQVESELLIKVINSGKGIDSEVLPHIFSKFVSASNSSGTGLGLYISKNIIEAHGGKIWGTNNLNEEGAVFSFSLPLDSYGA
ncbi:MAG: HAMP domain-containing sensor histidine kinase [Candidatus Nitrosocosmicus sp.]|nr:HAMP domain-containing histidine kinase [Candidatus Nitrosocosmicus sp.]